MAININKQEGDKLRAEEWNELAQEVMGKQPRLNIVDGLDSDSSVDVLSAKQGKVLDEKINSATSTINGISEKVNKLPTGYYYGQFDSVSGLPDASQLTQKGYAYVASEDSSIYYIYLFDGEGSSWEDSGNKFVTTALEDDLSTKSETKAPTTKVVAEGIEEVDLTKPKTASTELTSTQKYNANANISNRIADVEAETGVVKSLGYKVLNPNLSFAEQVIAANTIYEIKNKFNLNNGNVTIPVGCMLRFNGGKLVNGTLNIDGVTVSQDSVGVFGSNLALSGRPKGIPMADWFDDASDADKIMRCIEAFGVCNLLLRDYIIDKTILISKSFSLKGQGIPDFFGNYGQSGTYPSGTTWNYGGSRLIAQSGVTSIIKVDMSVNKYSSAIVENVSFTTAEEDRSAHGIEWTTPGGPSRPIIIRNCDFKFLNYGIYIHKGDYSVDNTNTGFVTIESNNASKNNWAVYCDNTYSLMGARFVSNNFEVNMIGGIYIGGNTTTICSYEIAFNDLEGNPTALDLGIFRCVAVIRGNYFEGIYGNNRGYINLRGYYPNYSRVSFLYNCFTGKKTDIKARYINIVDFENDVNKDGAIDMSYSVFSSFPSEMPIITNVGRIEKTIADRLPQIPTNNVFWYSNHPTNAATQALMAPDYIYDGIPLKEFTENTTVRFHTLASMRRSFEKDKQYNVLFYCKCLNGIGGTIRLLGQTSSSAITLIDKPVGHYFNDVYAYKLTFALEAAVTDAAILLQVLPSISNGVTEKMYLSDIFITETNEFYKPIIRCYNPMSILNATEGMCAYSYPLKRMIQYDGTNWRDSDGYSPNLKKGTTAKRPSLQATDNGYEYYDTDIKKSIRWNGTDWTDADGETVGLQVSDTSVLIGAAGSPVTINVYHANALTVSALNPDNTPATSWLTVPSTIAVGTNTLTISAAANTASNPRGAKVIIEDGTDVVIVNVVQNYSTT